MVRKADKADISALTKLAAALWDHSSEDELSDEFSQLLSQKTACFFLKYSGELPVGFAQCQLRRDYVEGAETSPVGYLEGIFVEQPYRRNGYAGELLAACEQWAAEQGCKEFASDCEINNDTSFRFHKAMDFSEANRIVCFTKKLKTDPTRTKEPSNGNRLVILRGNSGSGKTSLAHALQQQLGRHTMVISQDVIRLQMLWVRDGPDTPALPLLVQLLEYGAAHCGVTILEGILDARVYAPLFRRAIELYGENLRAFYYDLPFEETLWRHQTRDKRQEFGETAMRRWWKEKDFIGFLPETVLSTEVTLDEAVAQIVASLNTL